MGPEHHRQKRKPPTPKIQPEPFTTKLSLTEPGKRSNTLTCRKRSGDASYLADAQNLAYLPNTDQTKHNSSASPQAFKKCWMDASGTLPLAKIWTQLLKPTTRPVPSASYGAGLKNRKFESADIDRMLRDNIIDSAQTKWASIRVLASKKDCTFWCCVSYGKLHAVTKLDLYLTFCVDKYIDHSGSAPIFSTPDAHCGYWKIGSDGAKNDKIAFTLHHGLFLVIRMPFVLRNEPSTSQHIANVIFLAFEW